MSQKATIAARKLPPEPTTTPSLEALGEGAATLAGRVGQKLERMSDQRLAWAAGAVLFVLAAWPVALTEVPPFQDLPNHLAALTVIQHPERYPEFVSNGLFKTNAALFSFLYFVGGLASNKLAAKLFSLAVIAAGAFVLPHFLLQFTDRRRMVVASLLAWPTVHNWFVSMGMLDFALGVPCALLVLMAADRHRRAPSLKHAAALFAASFLTWYSHVFCLLIAGLLGLVHVLYAWRPAGSAGATDERWRLHWRGRLREALLFFGPQVPVLALTLWSVLVQLTEPAGAMHGFVALRRDLPPWELFYNMFAEWMLGFTWLSFSALLPTLVIPILAFRRRFEAPTYFGPAAALVLFAFYFGTPYVATNWFHVNSRFIAFLWIAMLLRVPARIDRRLTAALAVAALLYSGGMGIDYVRLDADRAKVTAGIPHVPQGAKLLPLMFNQKASSVNTRSVLHAWGFYVTEKQTSAPLLFAHSRSFPVMYRKPPPIQLNHLVLEAYAPTMVSPEWECSMLRTAGIVEPDCGNTWRQRWADFWAVVTPEFDHVMMWDSPPEVVALIPRHYRVKFAEDKLLILERVAPPLSERSRPPRRVLADADDATLAIDSSR